MCPGLTIWNWTIFMGHPPWKIMDSPSLCSHWLPVALHLEEDPVEFPHSHQRINWCYHYASLFSGNHIVKISCPVDMSISVTCLRDNISWDVLQQSVWLGSWNPGNLTRGSERNAELTDTHKEKLGPGGLLKLWWSCSHYLTAQNHHVFITYSPVEWS